MRGSVPSEHLQRLGTSSARPYQALLETECSIVVFLLSTNCASCSRTTDVFNAAGLKEVSNVTAFPVISFLDTAGTTSMLKQFGFKQTPAGCRNNR